MSEVAPDAAAVAALIAEKTGEAPPVVAAEPPKTETPPAAETPLAKRLARIAAAEDRTRKAAEETTAERTRWTTEQAETVAAATRWRELEAAKGRGKVEALKTLYTEGELTSEVYNELTDLVLSSLKEPTPDELIERKIANGIAAAKKADQDAAETARTEQASKAKDGYVGIIRTAFETAKPEDFTAEDVTPEKVHDIAGLFYQAHQRAPNAEEFFEAAREVRIARRVNDTFDEDPTRWPTIATNGFKSDNLVRIAKEVSTRTGRRATTWEILEAAEVEAAKALKVEAPNTQGTQGTKEPPPTVPSAWTRDAGLAPPPAIAPTTYEEASAEIKRKYGFG